MATKRRSHQRSEGSRRAILGAAPTLAVEAGYEGTTVADARKVAIVVYGGTTRSA